MNYNIKMKNNIQTKSIQVSSSGTHNLIKSTEPNPTSDPDFPQTVSSIGTDIRTDLNISWHNIQDIIQQQHRHDKNYSQSITDLKTIQYCNKSITQCLLILNWFVEHKFIQIFCQRVVSKIRVYQFVGCRDGLLEKFWVNSKVPVKDEKVLFAEMDDGAVFPALFQKCMAKIYGSYQQIPDNLVKLLQLWTCYALQSFTPKQQTPRQFIQFFQNSHKNKNLVLFRTRNSIRLQQIGIQNNTWFIIVRVLVLKINEQTNKIYLVNQQNYDNGDKKRDVIEDIVLAEFLEFHGCKWNGKYSKNSQFWRQHSRLAIQNKINTNPNSLQNYIKFSDLLSISRQLCILHNTQHYNINWYSSQSQSQSQQKNSNDWISPTPQIFSINLGFLPDLSPTIGHKKYHTIISIHFEEICRNWVYLVQEENCQLVSFCFKQMKETNFVIAMLEVGVSYLLYVRTYTRPINKTCMNINVTVYCEGSWAEIKAVQGNTWVEEKSFMGMLSQMKMVETQLSKDGQIRVGNMYKEMGLGFIVINLKPQFNKQVFLELNPSILKQQQMLLLCPKQPGTPKIAYNSPCHAILAFMLGSTYKEGDKFPAQNSIKVWVQPQIHTNTNTNMNMKIKLDTVNYFSYQ